ncbi:MULTISPECIES: DUF998 domain-containing protein [unclassified Brachybacterium]|uniref:DUF998 domain-containing protein n=1 Tax=unclassified Brachybacterium TaxID=2623841 RepID=UPI00360BCFD8
MESPARSTPVLSASARAGIVLWAVQVLYVPIELAAAAWSTAPYSLAHNTISDLGAVTCTSIPYHSQHVPVCSPAHVAVNGAFILFGAAMAVGAVLLRPQLPTGAMMTAAVALWVMTGLSSIGTGLTPLDQLLTLHVIVSLPGIVLSGVAMALTGAVLARSWDPRWWRLVAIGALSLVSGVVLLVRLEVQWGGLIERFALWPSFAACTVVALAALRRAGERGRPGPRQRGAARRRDIAS